MARAQNPNLEILMFTVDSLGELADAMVFLGGCSTGLLITDAAAPPIRVTRDVDAIVEVLSLQGYYQFSTKLRAKGFREDTSDGAPLCRWLRDDVILDAKMGSRLELCIVIGGVHNSRSGPSALQVAQGLAEGPSAPATRAFACYTDAEGTWPLQLFPGCWK